jgi:hypothetical protein
LLNESDRGAVLVGLAHLDSQIQQLLSAKFRSASGLYVDGLELEEFPDDLVGLSRLQEKSARKLLEYPGPLSTVAARQDLALSLGWISGDVFHDLTQLRKLRNKVAHSTDLVHLFDDPEIRKLVASLKFVDAEAFKVRAVYRHAFVLAIVHLHLELIGLTMRELDRVREITGRVRLKAEKLLVRYENLIEGYENLAELSAE